MAYKALSAKSAAALDRELMSVGGFSIDQLMELAGLSVSQAIYKLHPPTQGRKILLICGPGNNGGDALVAARHLWHYSYKPTIHYPKRPQNPLYMRLCTQLENLGVPFVDDFGKALEEADHVVDGIFGFSFHPPIREPFPSIIHALSTSKKPITSIDIPSSWDVETGPPPPGDDGSSFFSPTALVSLTAPKMGVRGFRGRHFLGGRFLSPGIAERYGVEMPEFEGVEQVVEVDAVTGVKL